MCRNARMCLAMRIMSSGIRYPLSTDLQQPVFSILFGPGLQAHRELLGLSFRWFKVACH